MIKIRECEKCHTRQLVTDNILPVFLDDGEEVPKFPNYEYYVCDCCKEEEKIREISTFFDEHRLLKSIEHCLITRNVADMQIVYNQVREYLDTHVCLDKKKLMENINVTTSIADERLESLDCLATFHFTTVSNISANALSKDRDVCIDFVKKRLIDSLRHKYGG